MRLRISSRIVRSIISSRSISIGMIAIRAIRICLVILIIGVRIFISRILMSSFSTSIRTVLLVAL